MSVRFVKLSDIHHAVRWVNPDHVVSIGYSLGGKTQMRLTGSGAGGEVFDFACSPSELIELLEQKTEEQDDTADRE